MLKIGSIRKSYKSFTLDSSLEVKKGSITGLVGQNGAGKSTLFKACLGLISTDMGQISILGKPLKEFTAKDKQKLGVVLSDSGFSGYLTVKDVMGILQNTYTQFDKKFFTEQTKRFGLPLDKKIKEFSLGMKAKLKVLVAISHNASFLILDEPTAGLDVIAREDVLTMLREFMEESEDRAILISSHIASDLETLSDELYMIHEGKIILHEDTDVLLSDYALLKVNEKEFEQLDKSYILYVKEETFGYSCLTNQRAFYMENYPSLTLERGGIDGIVSTVIKGEKNERFAN